MSDHHSVHYEHGGRPESEKPRFDSASMTVARRPLTGQGFLPAELQDDHRLLDHQNQTFTWSDAFPLQCMPRRGFEPAPSIAVCAAEQIRCAPHQLPSTGKMPPQPAAVGVIRPGQDHGGAPSPDDLPGPRCGSPSRSWAAAVCRMSDRFDHAARWADTGRFGRGHRVRPTRIAAARPAEGLRPLVPRQQRRSRGAAAAERLSSTSSPPSPNKFGGFSGGRKARHPHTKGP
jgi:hypothetical protein